MWVDTQKKANQHRDERMIEINQINNAIQRPVVGDEPPITLESLINGRWAQYISERELKPSTVYSYDSVLRTHILPELGLRELKEIVHIPSSVVDLLKAHQEAATFKRHEDFIFARSDGRPFDQDDLRNIVLYPALDRAEIKRESRSYGFHLFRHTTGSIAHELTSDLKLSQELLAHSHNSTTADIYVHGRREAKAGKATELLASQFVPVFSEEQELVSELVQ